MIIEDRACELWAKSLDDALGGKQYQTLLIILTEEKAQIQAIPPHYMVDSLRSFFTYPPPYADCVSALVKMGLIAEEEESPMQTEG